ncbi:glycosyltransferase [bacterium]|nr:glycosyltransferase [bacterium]
MLMIFPVPPLPADNGGKIRMINILKGLSGYFQIDVIFFYKSKFVLKESLELQAYRGVNTIHAFQIKINFLNKIFALTSLIPYHINIYRNLKIYNEISDYLKKNQYKYIYLHSLRPIFFVLNNNDSNIILDQHNVDRNMWFLRSKSGTNFLDKIFSYANYLKYIDFERYIYKNLWGIVSVSKKDMYDTRKYAYPDVQKYWVVPNGVDVTFFTPQKRYKSNDLSYMNTHKDNTITLSYMGAMDFEPNIKAVIYIKSKLLPILNQNNKHNFRFLVIGRSPVKKIRLLERKNTDKIIVTGTIQDVRPYLMMTDIFIAPIAFGGGTKLKILQVMSMGISIVCSEHAIQGLDVMDGNQVFIANNKQAYIEKILSLANNKDLRTFIGGNAREFVKEKFNWSEITYNFGHSLLNEG